ncbi:xylulokinase [Zeaxanthinibacter enoshimensis]|uniref:xylulokinase n=1 Tax=Zeaxanthinibacter enoshimensis TaxID=392009 RepID=UPI003569AB97
MEKYYIGYDIGSSSIKAGLVNARTGNKIGLVQHPAEELSIQAPEPGWAEQDPDLWYRHACAATKQLLKDYDIRPETIIGVGISYQMHGLVMVDDQGKILRPAIIWCDSRAVNIGNQGLQALGESYCSEHLLNSPGNFTLSKLRWVRENQAEVYKRMYKWMLPGDYLAFRLSGELCTTIPGLSEAISWDFHENTQAHHLLDHYDLDPSHIPEIIPTFSVQGKITKQAAKETGLTTGTPVLYRAGDQPNNALSLNVFEPGEVACTGGTSGVLYGVSEKSVAILNSGINSFAHVNHKYEHPRIGKLLCINGTGIQYRWLRKILNAESYDQMNVWAAEVPPGSEGLVTLPFGNGAERMLHNRIPGTSFSNINLNVHDHRHLCRASLEGIAFAFAHGMKLLKSEAVDTKVLKTGNDNLFRSPVFSTALSTLLDKEIELYDTTGAIGAARACKVEQEGLETLGKEGFKARKVKTYVPDHSQKEILQKAYAHWSQILAFNLND